jgi:methylisocitrate lyase
LNPGGARLREYIRDQKLVWAAGAWDVASALVIAKAGFEAVSIQTFQIAVREGLPDNGLFTPYEMVDLIRKVSRAVEIPVIVDFEQGYGDAYNAVFWLREYEKAGAAGVHIDDYDYLYRCPFLPPYLPTLRSDDDLVVQIEAMAAERLHRDTVIIARSGALHCRAYGNSQGRTREAIRRSKRYRDAGADIIFASVSNKAEFLHLRREVEGPFLLQLAIGAEQKGMKGGGKYAEGLIDLTADELHELGCDIITEPVSLQGVALKAMMKAAFEQRSRRSIDAIRKDTYTLLELEGEFMGIHRATNILGKRKN